MNPANANIPTPPDSEVSSTGTRTIGQRLRGIAGSIVTIIGSVALLLVAVSIAMGVGALAFGFLAALLGLSAYAGLLAGVAAGGLACAELLRQAARQNKKES